MRCMLCNKELGFMTPTHLCSCVSNVDCLDTRGYRERFPSAPLSSDSRNQKISVAGRGRVFTAEQRKNISLGKMGKRRRDGGVMLGKHHSTETRVKISQSLREYVQPRERIERRRRTMQKYRGANNPAKRPETRAKISADKKRVIIENSVQGFPWTGDPNVYPNFRAGFREDLGHFVRSSWEANVARVLKFLGKDYEYEKQRFVLYRNGDLFSSYLPDFFLGDNILWEVRGFVRSGGDIREKKLELFREQYPEWDIYVIDAKQYHLFKENFSYFIPKWE